MENGLVFVSPPPQCIVVRGMFLRSFLCLLLFATSSLAQFPRPTLEPIQPPSVLAAVSHDGFTVAVARSSGGAAKRFGRVELWNSNTGELQRTITGFDGPIWSMTFSHDGKTLITVSTEFREAKIQASVKDRNEKVFAELKWWDTRTGEFVKKVPLANENVAGVEAAWSPSGDVIALVERYSERQLTQVGERGAFGQRILVPGYENVQEVNLRLLDAQTGEKRVKVEDVERTTRGYLTVLFGRLESPIFSPDGKLLAAISAADVNVWSAETGKKLQTFKKLAGAPAAIAFSPDSRVVAVASVKGKMPGGESEITLREVATGKVVNKLKGRNDLIECLEFADEGRELLIGSLQYEPERTTGTLKIWDLGERLRRVNIREGEAVSSLALLPNESAVVVQSGSNVELRDANTFQVRYSFEPGESDETESMRRSRFLLSANRAQAVTFSSDGTTVSAEIPGEGIRSWDARTGGLKERVPTEKRSEAERDATRLFNVDETGVIQVREAGPGKSKRTIAAGQKVTAVAIDAAGHLLAAALADHSIGLWDLKTGALQAELKKHQDVVNALAFSPDGKTLASGGDDRTAILWDVSSGKAKRTLKGHDLTVTSLAFSPDGLTLASGSGNASVVLWNVTTGKLDRILR